MLEKFYAQLELTTPSKYKMHTDSFYSITRGKVAINAYSGITISEPSLNPQTVSKIETDWYRATH